MNTETSFTPATSPPSSYPPPSAYPAAACPPTARLAATWTTERVQKLRSYVTAGLTCSQIADEIGVSRNAVIGKIHRLGLSPGRRPAALAKQMGSAPAQTRTRRSLIARLLRATVAGPSIAPAETTAELAAVEVGPRCSLLDLTPGGCRWPLGDPGKDDFGFCGHDSIAGISYCAGHARLAYRLPSGRRA